jgi:hypothetical protein
MTRCHCWNNGWSIASALLNAAEFRKQCKSEAVQIGRLFCLDEARAKTLYWANNSRSDFT